MAQHRTRDRVKREQLGIESDSTSPHSIGFSKKEQKWFGWSHRAMFGFGIGHKVKAGDVIAGAIPVGTTAKTLGDARRMAEAFAEAVS
jgi:hypothetical protein